MYQGGHNTILDTTRTHTTNKTLNKIENKTRRDLLGSYI